MFSVFSGIKKFPLICRHCTEYKVLGFDCEWVTVGGARRPVALLQLASHRGLCALFRLCHLQRIPPELKVRYYGLTNKFDDKAVTDENCPIFFSRFASQEILEDENILKVGVEPSGDASYLAKDFNICVASTLDLRFLALQSQCRAGGLAKLSDEHLNVKLDKDWRIRCSDWEANTLSSAQVAYAAKDAHVAVELFKVFADKLKPRSFWQDTKKYLDDIIDEYCFSYLDLHFKAIHAAIGVAGTSNDGKKGGPAVFSNKFQSRNISTRKKPLYYNCFLQAPDGELLCTCAKKKAMWCVPHTKSITRS